MRGTKRADVLTRLQLLGIMMDSTLNNDTLANELAIMLPGIFCGLRACVHMDHVVNIAAQCAMLMFDASPVELAHALDEVMQDLEQMGEGVTEASDAPAHDDDGDESLESPVDVDLGVELGDMFEGTSEERKEDLCQQIEPMRESISKVRTGARACGPC